jgi:hypothetical protein
MRRVLWALVLASALAVAVPASAGADTTAGAGPGSTASSEPGAQLEDPCPIDENGNCLSDRDGDGVSDTVDNCPDHWNAGQEDNDGDGFGNPCDPTPNGDGDGGDDPPPPPPPPPGCASSAPVILFEHVDFGGACWGFWPGSHASVGDANDKASSIRVAAGYVVSLFQHPDFGGSWHNTETSSSPWGWSSVGNDSVSSLVVQSSGPDPTWYEGDELGAPEGIGSSPAASGCARVGDSVKFRTSSGRIAWVYALRVSFCWDGAAITSIWARDVVADIPPLPFPYNLIAGWNHTPLEFVPGEPGHVSTNLRARAKFEFCGFRYGCLNPRHPWIAIELRGSGSALCTSSVARSPRACIRGRA